MPNNLLTIADVYNPLENTLKTLQIADLKERFEDAKLRNRLNAMVYQVQAEDVKKKQNVMAWQQNPDLAQSALNLLSPRQAQPMPVTAPPAPAPAPPAQPQPNSMGQKLMTVKTEVEKAKASGDYERASSAYQSALSDPQTGPALRQAGIYAYDIDQSTGTENVTMDLDERKLDLISKRKGAETAKFLPQGRYVVSTNLTDGTTTLKLSQAGILTKEEMTNDNQLQNVALHDPDPARKKAAQDIIDAKQKEKPLADKVAPAPKGYKSPQGTNTGYVYMDQRTGKITGDAPDPTMGAKIRIEGLKQMMTERAKAYAKYAPEWVVDKQNNNQLVYKSKYDLAEEEQKNPGRYVSARIAGPIMKTKANFGEVRGALEDFETTLKALPVGEFSTTDKAKLAQLLKEPDATSAKQAFINSELAETLTPEQQTYVVTLLSLKESMTMLRTMTGPGGGTIPVMAKVDQMIKGMYPKAMLIQQIGALSREVRRLERAVPGGITLSGEEVKLKENEGWEEVKEIGGKKYGRKGKDWYAF